MSTSWSRLVDHTRAHNAVATWDDARGLGVSPDDLRAWHRECDSMAHHSGTRAHEWDRMRRRRLKAPGWDLVEVTYDDVTLRRGPDRTRAHGSVPGPGTGPFCQT